MENSPDESARKNVVSGVDNKAAFEIAIENLKLKLRERMRKVWDANVESGISLLMEKMAGKKKAVLPRTA